MILCTPGLFHMLFPQFEWSTNLQVPAVTQITVPKILILPLYTLYLAWSYLLKLNAIHSNNHSLHLRVRLYFTWSMNFSISSLLIFSIFHICNQRINCVLNCPVLVSLAKKKKTLASPVRLKIFLCDCPLHVVGAW